MYNRYPQIQSFTELAGGGGDGELQNLTGSQSKI